MPGSRDDNVMLEDLRGLNLPGENNRGWLGNESRPGSVSAVRRFDSQHEIDDGTAGKAGLCNTYVLPLRRSKASQRSRDIVKPGWNTNPVFAGVVITRQFRLALFRGNVLGGNHCLGYQSTIFRCNSATDAQAGGLPGDRHA